MIKFSKINENKIDTIKEILLEIDLVDGVSNYSLKEEDSKIIVYIYFNSAYKSDGKYVISSKRIESLIEIFSTIQRINSLGYKAYITYIVTNSKQMVFEIKL